jgi:hypothetical protein
MSHCGLSTRRKALCSDLPCNRARPSVASREITSWLAHPVGVSGELARSRQPACQLICETGLTYFSE